MHKVDTRKITHQLLECAMQGMASRSQETKQLQLIQIAESQVTTLSQSGYEALKLKNGSSANTKNLNATGLRF